MKNMVRVIEEIMLSKAMELLRETLESMSVVQLCVLGLWVLGLAVRRGMDVVAEFIFARLLKLVLAGERRGQVHSAGRRYVVSERRTEKLETRAVVGASSGQGTSRSAEETTRIYQAPRYGKVYAVRRGCEP